VYREVPRVRIPLSPPEPHVARAAALILLLAAAACGPTLPWQPVQRALVRDVQRVVDVRGNVGWFIDESEIQAVLPDVMKSFCQVPLEDRESSLVWLDRYIAELGGPDVVAAWRARGKKVSKVEELLLVSRTRMLLARATEWANQGRCPFWLEPTPRFHGVHTQDYRFIATIEGGGRITQEYALGRVRFGGGGSGRILVGYGIAEGWGLTTGLEIGGGARFTNLALGEQSEFPQIVGQAAAPVVLRRQLGLTTHAELEAGPMAYFDRGSADASTREVKLHFDWGVRLGAALGGTYLRLHRGFIPKFAVAFTVDFVPAMGEQPGLTQIGLGLRTGLDFSRWFGF
jgi:hypothetical protein